MTPAEACERLGIAANSSPEVIRAAYEARQRQTGSCYDLAVLAELEEIRNALSLTNQISVPQHSPDDPIEQIIGIISLYYIPREGLNSEEQLRAALQPFFLRQTLLEPPLSPEEGNGLEQQIQLGSAQGRVIETETDHVGQAAVLGQTVYHFLVWLPWLLIPATLLALGTSWLMGPEGLWDRWLGVVALTTALLPACLLLAVVRRFSTPRWRLLDGPNGRTVEFPTLGIHAEAGSFQIRTSWLGRLCGLAWVAPEQGKKPVLVCGLFQTGAGDPARSIQEGFSVAVLVSGIVFVLLRSFSEPVRQALSQDDRVLMLLLLAAIAYLAVGRLLSWLA